MDPPTHLNSIVVVLGFLKKHIFATPLMRHISEMSLYLAPTPIPLPNEDRPSTLIFKACSIPQNWPYFHNTTLVVI